MKKKITTSIKLSLKEVQDILSGKGDGSLFFEAEDLTFKWNIKQGNDARDYGEYIPTHIESLTIEYSEFKELGES